MAAAWIELVTGSLEDKKRYRQFKARTRALSPGYRTAVEAVERYLMYAGRGEGSIAMYEDLIDLFEQSAASGTPVHEIVGDDPVEFVEAFSRNYPEGQWRIREQSRLISAIERAAGEETGKAEGSV